MNIDPLRKACKGTVVAAGEPDFKNAVDGGLWNRRIPGGVFFGYFDGLSGTT